MKNTHLIKCAQAGLYKKAVVLALCLCLLPAGGMAEVLPLVRTEPAGVLPGLHARIGHADEVWDGGNGKTIYLIRDAHDSVEAQKNIAEIIHYLVREQGVRTVYEEGYEGVVPTDLFFEDIQDIGIRERVSRQLLEELRIGGAEYAHINRKLWIVNSGMEKKERSQPAIEDQASDKLKQSHRLQDDGATLGDSQLTIHNTLSTNHDFRLIGADRLSTHLKNILDYREAARSREAILSDLEAIQKELDRMVDDRFPAPARQWMKLKERFEEEKLDLTEYLRRSVQINLGFESSNVFAGKYPQLTLFLRALESKNAAVIRKAKQIRGRVFNQELSRFEKDLAGRLLDEPLLERVYSDYQTVQLARRLALMELSPSDFSDVQSLLKDFKTRAFAEFAAKQNSKTVVLSRRWEKKIQRAVRFYQTALSRETAAVERLEEFLRNPAETKTALVFGGFHAPQIKESLRSMGFSYVVIDPVISKISKRDSNLYRSLMAGDERLKTLPSVLAKMSRVMSDFEWAALGLTTVTDVRMEIAHRASVLSAGARMARSEVRSEGGASEKKPNPRRYIPEESITEVEDARWIEFFSGLIQLGYNAAKLGEVRSLFRHEAESGEEAAEAYFKMLAQAAAQPAEVMTFAATLLAAHPLEQWLSLLSHHLFYFHLRELLNLSRQQDGYQDAWLMVTQERVIEGEGIRFDVQMPAAFFEDGWYEDTGNEIIRFTQHFLSRLAVSGDFHVRVANNVTALREDPEQVSLRGFDGRELELLEFTRAQKNMPILQIYRGEETGTRGMPAGILDVPAAFILQPKFEETVLRLVDSGAEQLDITAMIEPLWLHEIYKKPAREMSLREGSEVLAAWLEKIEKQIDWLKTQRAEKDLIFAVGTHQRAANISIYRAGQNEHLDLDAVDKPVYLGQSIRGFDKKRWKTEWEDTRRSEVRTSTIRGAVLTEPANGATFEPSSDGSVTVKFLLDLDQKPWGSFIPNMMINQLGLKAYLRYSFTDEFGQESPWSTPETDIPLEITSGIHTWPFAFGSRYEVAAHFVLPEGAARLKFNIRLETNSGEYWFQNGTPDNNWQISVAPPTPRWLISKDYSTRAEADPAALRLEEKRDYGPSEQRWEEPHFMAALRRRDTVGRALEGYYGSWSGLKGFYVYRLGGIDFIRILKFAEDSNQPRAGALLFEDALDRAGGERVLVMHLAGDYPARLDSYEKLGFQVERVEHLYGSGYPGYRLLANTMPDSDLVKIFERSDRDAFLDYWTYEAARQLPITGSQKVRIALLQNIRWIFEDLMRQKETLVRADPESLIRVLRSAIIFFRRPALSEAEKDTLRTDITQLVLARLQGDILWLKKSSDDPLLFFNLRFYNLAMQIKPDANATKKEFLDALVGPYANRMKTWIEHGRAPEEGLSELWQYRNQAMGMMEGWYEKGLFGPKDFQDYVKEIDAALRPHALRLMSKVLYRVGIEDAAARVQIEDELWSFLEEDQQAKDQSVFLLDPPRPNGKFRRKKGEARVQLYPARVREVPYAVTHLMTGVMPGAREIALFPVYDGSYETETIHVNHVIDALQYVRFYEIDYQGGKAFLAGDRQSDLYRALAEVAGVKGRYDDWRWVQDLVLEFYARREGASAIIVPTAEAVKKRWPEINPKFVKFAYDTDMDLHGYTKQPLPDLPWEGGITLTEGWVMPLDNDPEKLKKLETFLKPYPMVSEARSEMRTGARRDYWILSNKGTAPDEMAERIRNAGSSLKTAEIPWELVTPLLEEGFERLRARNQAAADHWDQTYLPKIMLRLESALERLYRMRDSKNIFVVEPIGHSKKDFALGYAAEDALYIVPSALSLEPRVLAHYLLRVAELLESDSDSHFVFESKDRSLFSLGDYRDQAVMDLAVVKGGRDLRREMQDFLQDPAQAEEIYYMDESDARDLQDVGNFARNHPNMVLYGDFLALEKLVESGWNKMEAPVVLDRSKGLLGVWNVPEFAKAWIALAVERQEIQQVRVPLALLQQLWFLKQADYPEIDGLLDQLIQRAVTPEHQVTLTYPVFNNIFRAARSKLLENSVTHDEHHAWEKKRRESDVLSRVILRFAGQAGLANLFRQTLLADRGQSASTLALFEEIYSLQHSDYGRGFSWGEALWAAYLSSENTPDETAFFRTLLDQARERHYEIGEKLPYWIFHVLKEPDAQKASRAMDLFYHLPWNENMRREIFEIMALIPTEREKAAAFAYLNTHFFGTDVEETHRMSYGEEDPVIALLGPEFSQGTAYVLAMRDLRRGGGAGASDVDGRLVWAARELDDGADVPGSRGRTWFSHYRERVHTSFQRDQLTTVSSILEFLNTGNDDALKRERFSLERIFTENVSAAQIESYQTILRKMLKRLKEQGVLSDIHGSVFLTEMITLSEEEVIQSLSDANLEGSEEDLTKVEMFLRLYFAFSEKFGAVGYRMREALTEAQSTIGRWKLGSSQSGFVKFYGRMIQAMNGNQTVKAFASLTHVREILMKRLQAKSLKERNPHDEDLQTLLELERVLRVLGYEWLPDVLKAIDQALESGQWNEAARLTAAAGRFIYSSGFGGADYRDFLRELERGSLSRTQLRDLIRALLSETRKAHKKTNVELRSALNYIRPRLDQPHDLTPEVRSKIKTVLEKQTESYEGGQHEYEVEVIPEEARVDLENLSVDEFIRKSGLPQLEQALSRWEERLRDLPMSGQEKKIRRARTIQGLEDYFLRFGQQDIPARPKLLSLWSRKGLNLLRMAKKGIEVPPGVIASAELTFQPEIRKSPEFKAQVLEEVERLRRFSRYPDLKLLIYARSGSAFMMPGLMMTIPNLGMNDREASELAASTGDEWFAYDTYAELLRSFGINIFSIPETEFQEVFDVYKKDEASGEQMIQAVEGYKQLLAKHEKELPESLIDQVMLAMENVYGSWDSETARNYRARHELSDDWGTVVILQKGIFGNLKVGEGNDVSGVGAATLRQLPDGSDSVQGKFRIRSIGEQLMTRAENYRLLSRSQRVADEITFEDQYPDLFRQLNEQAQKLKHLFGYTQLFEFVIERGHLWVTQSNDDYQTDDFPELAETNEEPLGRGHGVSGGAVRGWAATTLESAKRLLERFQQEKPEEVDGVILLVDRVNPEFISEIPQGVHLIAGKLSIHAETLAQTNGIAAIYGVQGMERDAEGVWRIGVQTIADGTVLTIDGHENPLVYHDSGKVFLGSLPLKPKGRSELRTLREKNYWETDNRLLAGNSEVEAALNVPADPVSSESSRSEVRSYQETLQRGLDALENGEGKQALTFFDQAIEMFTENYDERKESAAKFGVKKFAAGLLKKWLEETGAEQVMTYENLQTHRLDERLRGPEAQEKDRLKVMMRASLLLGVDFYRKAMPDVSNVQPKIYGDVGELESLNLRNLQMVGRVSTPAGAPTASETYQVTEPVSGRDYIVKLMDDRVLTESLGLWWFQRLGFSVPASRIVKVNNRQALMMEKISSVMTLMDYVTHWLVNPEWFRDEVMYERVLPASFMNNLEQTKVADIAIQLKDAHLGNVLLRVDDQGFLLPELPIYIDKERSLGFTKQNFGSRLAFVALSPGVEREDFFSGQATNDWIEPIFHGHVTLPVLRESMKRLEAVQPQEIVEALGERLVEMGGVSRPELLPGTLDRDWIARVENIKKILRSEVRSKANEEKSLWRGLRPWFLMSLAVGADLYFFEALKKNLWRGAENPLALLEWSFAGGLLILGSAGAMTLGLGAMVRWLNFNEEKLFQKLQSDGVATRVENLFRANKAWAVYLLALLWVPHEEILITGVLFPWMATFFGSSLEVLRASPFALSWTLAGAMALTAAIFSVLHRTQNSISFVFRFLFSISMILLYSWSGSILAPMIAHVLFDFQAFIGIHRTSRERNLKRAQVRRSEVRSESNVPLTILRGGQMIKEDSSEEVLAIYDEDGNLKGSQLREEAHAASEWHAVSHVYLFDVQGRLLLQKRASHLQQSPGALQVSVSGHVASDESPDLAALRKGYEELGIHLDPSRLKKMAVLKRSYAYKADAAWQNREFAFIYVYQVTDEEIAEMEKNYNLLASEELWLIPSDVVAGMVFKNPKQFSNSVRGVVNERPELWKVLSEKGTETPMNDGLASKNVLGWHEQTLISLGDYARFAELNSEKKNAIRNILGFLKQDNRSIRSMAYRTLRRIPQAAPFLLELASDEDPETASLAMISLSFLLRKRGLLPEGEEIQRAEIHEALFQRIKRVLLPFSEMSDALEDKDQTKLERSALQALGYLDHAETADLFARKLARIDGDDDEFLGSKLLEAAAASDSAGVRRQVLEAFARLAREMPIEKIPLELSRLLDAKWMSDYLQDLPGLRLAKRFGYIDQALYKAAQAPEGEAIFPVMRKLIAQVGVATQTLTTRYLAEPEDSRETLVEGWRQKQLDWMRMFLPEELTPVPALKPVSVELTETGEIGRDLFFGALRESDWANAEDKRETPPFGYEHQEKHGGRFYYAGRDLFQFLWEDKLKRAKTIMGESVSEDVLHVLMPYYAADAMAIETETRKEPREEAAARVSGRWRAVAGLLEVHEGRLILKPEMAKRISLEADLPRGQVGVSLEDRAALSDFISRLAANRSVWKYALLDFQAMSRANLFMARAQRDPDWQTLSFGSRSALKLYAYDLTKNSPHTNDELWPEWEVKFKQLAGEEGRNRGIMPSLPLRGGKDKDADSAVGVMPSLGMELQSVNISPAQVYLWKQALPFFDIPSPERLRYGHIVETAFRPAWTASAFLLALPILHRMGLMGGEHYKSAAAFHISLSGDLGAEARWIALPLLMYRGDKTDKDLTLEERASRSAWVLSKGYIHRNRENQKADPESEAPQFHTEIRTARFANVEKGNAELLGDYEKFLPAVQYLGAALTAFKKTERPEVVLTDIEKTLSQVWREYQDALSVIVSEIPEAQNLMNADWYESTGDAKDAALVKQLDIFKRIVALFEYKKQNMEVYEGFAERVKKILLDYAGQAQMAVAGQAARSEVRSFSSGSREQRPEASKIREERVRPKERMAEKIFRQEPVYRKVLLKYRDIADNFTGTNSGRLHELAVLAARYPQVRFQIYEADFEDAHYLEIRKLFKAMTNVRFQAQPGGAGLSLSQPGREEANEKILHLSTQAFDARQRFGAKVKKIHFMRTGSSRGALAAALLYNPEHWLFRTRMHKQGDFWVLGSSLARLGRQWLAGFVIAASA